MSVVLIASAAASFLGLSSKLTFKDNLLQFYPRVTGANLTPEVEVRFWDPKGAQAVVGNTGIRSDTAKISGQDPAALADSFGGMSLPAGIPMPAIPGLPSLGSEPSAKAFLVVDHPLAADMNSGAAALLTTPFDGGMQRLRAVNSPNHQGEGQNVLYIDGHVSFHTTRAAGIDGDDIYVNQEGHVSAGCNLRDSVLGASWVRPYPQSDE